LITWLRIWPLLLMPTVILSALAAFPTSLIGGRVLGGGPVREYYVYHFLLPVLPANASAALVNWFATASSMQEWLLAFAVPVNLNAILLPLLYALGVFVIQVSSWVAKKDIQLKRDSIR
jgi:hypothetical protein